MKHVLFLLLVTACLSGCSLFGQKNEGHRSFRGICVDDVNGTDGLYNPERGFRLEVALDVANKNYLWNPAAFPDITSYLEQESKNYASDSVSLVQTYFYLTDLVGKDLSAEDFKTMDVFSVANIAKFDYFIIPGCVLTVPFFKIYGELLRNKVKQGCKLIFLAASGNHYTDYEVNYVSEFLKELKPYAIMTRDSVAYKHYAKFSENTYNGIDNVFFVNRLDIPKCETTVSPYIVLNFDEPKHNGIKELLAKKFADKNIIYTNHKPFPYANVSKLVKKGIMVSDYPLDYLLLYKNVTETHSDRVHACIPTLSFGNKAQLYSDSPRSALFENVGITDIKDHPVKVEGLKEMQDKQICFLKRILI